MIDPHSTLYAVSQAGVVRSTNGAVNWSQTGLAGANGLTIDPSNPSTLYAASGGVYTITFVPEMQ